MKNFLQDRTYEIEGNWYSPIDKLKNFKSVVKADYINQSSSAGDWDGYFIQRVKKHYCLFTFSQSNNYPNDGFTLQTSNLIASAPYVFDEIEINEILNIENNL